MQGRSEDQRDLLDAESVTGHLMKPGSVFAFLARHRKRLFPDLCRDRHTGLEDVSQSRKGTCLSSLPVAVLLRQFALSQ